MIVRRAFQAAPGFEPPPWPSPMSEQQMHIDVRVDDLDTAEADVVALGAQRTGGGDGNFRIYRDPDGHPFCLVKM